MATEANIHYKILFDAMATFSLSVYNVEKMEDLPDILSRQLKYLFNFQSFHYYFIENENYQSILLQEGQLSFKEGNVRDLKEEELQVYQMDVPILKNWELGENIVEKRSWKFLGGANSCTLISLTSVSPQLFTNKYIPILKIVNEVIRSKIKNIKLLSLLTSNNITLEQMTQKLQIQNSKIEDLIKHQEKIIDIRTIDLKNSNDKLSSLIQFNAHQIREPLTRILSLMEIKNEIGEQEFISDFLPMIETSVQDLDKSIHDIINTSEILH